VSASWKARQDHGWSARRSRQTEDYPTRFRSATLAPAYLREIFLEEEVEEDTDGGDDGKAHQFVPGGSDRGRKNVRGELKGQAGDQPARILQPYFTLFWPVADDESMTHKPLKKASMVPIAMMASAMQSMTNIASSVASARKCMVITSQTTRRNRALARLIEEAFSANVPSSHDGAMRGL
jgi:hypothetical protein